MEGEGGSGGGIEEIGSRAMGSSGGESRWVDGSEVESDPPPPWSLFGDDENREGYASLRRRLIKKPKRADSFDVEAMEIAGSHSHGSKVLLFFSSQV